MSATPNCPPALQVRSDFDAIFACFEAEFLSAPPVHCAKWQSTQAPQPMPEIFNANFTLHLRGVETSKDLAYAIQPNLPWADQHFIRERVSGEPLNPGTTWRTWPYAQSAARHRVGEEDDPPFDHSYAERYWPKFAGKTQGGRISPTSEQPDIPPISGIRDEYGDLGDLIKLMGKDPYTRQGFLPVWFPEDLVGALNSRRVPCSLGYHFIQRNEELHCVYHMRSCDFIRHFRDDVYLTLRLQSWLLQTLRHYYPENWTRVRMGSFTMTMTSLHMFEQDQTNLILSKSRKG